MSSNNVVLVHGGFVDGSGWQGVYNLLAKQGFTVTCGASLTAKHSTSTSSRATNKPKMSSGPHRARPHRRHPALALQRG